MHITIIANGRFPVSPKPLSALQHCDAVVCCDGALAKYLQWYRTTDLRPPRSIAVVGDGDSLDPTSLEEARGLHLDIRQCHVSEQESNDLSKAVCFAVGQAHEQHIADADIRIDILGATGLREDHTIANISLLSYYTTLFPAVTFRMLSDHCTLLPMEGSGLFDTTPGQQISLFSLTPDIPVSVSGLRYPIHHRCLHWWWEGSLNEALSDHFTIQGGKLVIMINDNC